MWRFYDGTWWDSECDFSDQLWCHRSFLTLTFSATRQRTHHLFEFVLVSLYLLYWCRCM
jgi:hypothetical protein